MSAILARRPRRAPRRFNGPRIDDPRVVRTRSAVVEAARTLFLRHGYAGTTMDDIAALAGITKRTMYNNYPDKDALFSQVVAEVITFAGGFARELRRELSVGITAANRVGALHDIGRRLALAVLRPEVISLRRLLIGEARALPSLAKEYFDRAPGQVIQALASGFRLMGASGLRVTNSRRAAAQFAYLVVGEPLDRAVLTGVIPPRTHVLAYARDGVETFLARYGR
jgi:TetR/AcrR family transcriptional repressor of mexJK operon